MQSKYLLFTFIALIFQINAFAGTTEILFINANDDAEAASVDLEITDVNAGTVWARYTDVDYLTARDSLIFPTGIPVKIRIYEAGTSTGAHITTPSITFDYFF